MSDQNRTQMLNADPNKTRLDMAPAADPNKTIMGVGPSLNVTQTIKPVQCPVCKTFNPAGLFFCMDCGLIFDRALPGDAFGAPAIQLPMLVESGGKEYPIRPGTNTLGREADITVSDSRASRRHAQITSSPDGTVTVEDLGSTNGTKVNGTALVVGVKQPLSAGDKISLGGFELQFVLPGGATGNVTQAFAGNKTAAISSAPKKEVAPARLVGGDFDAPLKAGANTFGRKDENDVPIKDAYVSGKHGIIEVTDQGVFITDIGSSNGTLLNESKLSPNMRTQMRPDDVLRLGSLELRVVLADK